MLGVAGELAKRSCSGTNVERSPMQATRLGLFEAAGGGTLLLDELLVFPLGLQAKSAEAIEDRSIRPIGSHESD